MDLHEADKLLVALLRKAGDEWGPLGVAKVAAQLVDHRLVREPEPLPEPIMITGEQMGDDRVWPEVVAIVLALAVLAAFLAVAIL